MRKFGKSIDNRLIAGKPQENGGNGMTNFDWRLMKARKRMQRRREARILQHIKKGAAVAVLGITAALSLGLHL